MTNPFDRVINIQNEKAPEVENINTSVNKKHDGNINISFSLNKTWAERGAFLIIIAILAFFAFNPVGNECVDENKLTNQGAESLTGNVILEQPAEESTEIELISETEKEEAVVEEVKTEEIEEAPAEEVYVEKPFRHNFDFEIVKIDYERDDEEDRPKKMKSITFLMRNRWKTFKPRIEVYWYDIESNGVIKEKKRTIKYYKTIGIGTSQQYTIMDFDSTFFDPTNDPETVVLKLYDIETDLLMDTTTQIIT